VHGPAAGIKAVEAIKNRDELDSYYLLYAVLGEFEAQLHHSEAAAALFKRASQLTEVKSERAFLSRKARAHMKKSSGVAGVQELQNLKASQVADKSRKEKTSLEPGTIC
jgi:hypothetical protein